jgi:hypothetical protein
MCILFHWSSRPVDQRWEFQGNILGVYSLRLTKIVGDTLFSSRYYTCCEVHGAICTCFYVPLSLDPLSGAEAIQYDSLSGSLLLTLVSKFLNDISLRNKTHREFLRNFGPFLINHILTYTSPPMAPDISYESWTNLFPLIQVAISATWKI